MTPTITADADAGIVVAISVRLVRTAQVQVPDRAPVQVGTTLAATLVTPSEVVAPAMTQVAEFESNRDTHQIVGRIIPALLVVFAVVLLAFGLPKLVQSALPTHSAVVAEPAGRSPAPGPATGGTTGPTTGRHGASLGPLATALNNPAPASPDCFARSPLCSMAASLARPTLARRCNPALRRRHPAGLPSPTTGCRRASST